ncbi:hypothetical protein I5R65_21730 [Herbaspirillum sp. AP02]|uniref:hypothetical protein n=1 Tax=unclassified Herbaspirillum TaxID=2624150 RepID=UPI0015D9D678|nr:MULTISPECIES: hypothetical protein [unclassified Herbaspirillum]MBG7622102.1 hypothetical protein [Herbaspirillum sp. AP02]NZD69121.1 hypothetical protein [Herbaspirillum sp. AP21]
MTSVIAWIAQVDKRRPEDDERPSTRGSGLYFATDSRRTVEQTLPGGQIKEVLTDDCVKAFAPAGTRDIFAFAGDATFPPAALGKIETLLSGDTERFNAMDAYERSAEIFNILKTDFDALLTKPTYEFWILHGTRTGAMSGAEFHLFQYSYTFENPQLTYGIVQCDTEHSVALERLGTGKAVVLSSVEATVKKSGTVSSSQFSAFCDAVQGRTATQDKYSGGPIQLVGLLNINDAIHMGVVTPIGTYFRGSTSPPSNPKEFYWRNTTFENVDIDGSPRKNLK